MNVDRISGLTNELMPPEYYQGEITEKSDMWQLGQIFFRMIFGFFPLKPTPKQSHQGYTPSDEYHLRNLEMLNNID
jgi:serine/threonine protein kinase